ncbi:6-phosphogluconolactonase [Aequorivita sp. H23M31]|uniref:6-phosphogluconolactonase n=1 Tax=Aequorivita ciconiae TaxID=2494375 RepID=A0A410G752_9FLAO|nr:6-phosphogluconolactonase [Aequorivita sp. H23M31]QAA83092.1 6-phosphogluconolactonase [Aequorivita sp. H23M31]
MELQVFIEIDEMINSLAQLIKKSSQEAISTRGQFNFVLSGGSSPKRLYELLASEPFKNSMDWPNIYFFFGDERYVPENDSQRNSLMAKETLFDRLNISDSNIFMVDTTYSPSKAAQNYNKTINLHFNNKPVHFDFILLGLGDNAHTASLFPFTSVLDETKPTVKSIFVDELDMYRITMTAPMINRARQIAFLVFGKDKADAVSHVVLKTKYWPQHYPAQLISPRKGELFWFLDIEAGSLIRPKMENKG